MFRRDPELIPDPKVIPLHRTQSPDCADLLPHVKLSRQFRALQSEPSERSKFDGGRLRAC